MKTFNKKNHLRAIACTSLAVVASLLLPQAVQAQYQTDQQIHDQEEAALEALVPLTAVTNTAIASGNWSDPTIWDNGVPGTGANVEVPAGIAVNYDTNDATPQSIRTLRVDGEFDFATNINTTLKIDTIVVLPNAIWNMGTAANPIAAGVTANVIFADNGAINKTWDPTVLSRGFISHGVANLHGQTKTTFLPLTTGIPAGSTSLTLTATPMNWNVGDQIIVTATDFNWTPVNEIVNITAVNGATVSFSPPLAYDHVPPAGPRFMVYATNLTRNVVFQTENAATVATQARGHVMFMHVNTVDCEYVEFLQLGRTDKSRDIDDYAIDSPRGARLLDTNGYWIPGPLTNQRARYACHFHRTGNTDIKATPAICKGCSVIGSPGWGFVNHESYVNIDDCVAYDCFGSSFATEDGDELGRFNRDIAIKAFGDAFNSPPKAGVGNHDLGHGGHGFWLQGRDVAIQDCVVNNTLDDGIIFLHRSRIENPEVAPANLANPYGALGAAKGGIPVEYQNVPLASDTGNVVIGSIESGFHSTKDGAYQGHDLRNFVDNLTAWHCRRGAEIEYVEKYTLRNCVFLGQYNGGGDSWPIKFANTEFGSVVVNCTFGNFTQKILTGSDLTDVGEVSFVNSTIDGHAISPSDLTFSDPAYMGYYSSAQLNQSVTVSFVPTPNQSYVLTPNYYSGLGIGGTKTDSLGPVGDGDGWGDDQYTNLSAQGYYVDGNGNKFIVLNSVFTDRITGDGINYQYAAYLPTPQNPAADGSTGWFRALGPNLGTYPGTLPQVTVLPPLASYAINNTSSVDPVTGSGTPTVPSTPTTLSVTQ